MFKFGFWPLTTALDVFYPTLSKDIVEAKEKIKKSTQQALVPLFGVVRKTAVRFVLAFVVLCAGFCVSAVIYGIVYYKIVPRSQ